MYLARGCYGCLLLFLKIKTAESRVNIHSPAWIIAETKLHIMKIYVKIWFWFLHQNNKLRIEIWQKKYLSVTAVMVDLTSNSEYNLLALYLDNAINYNCLPISWF